MDNPENKISEKRIQINGLNINYKTIGNGEIPVVLLHGWGISSDKYSALAEHLSQFSIFNFQFSIFIPDLPGFGKSDEPNKNWGLDNYVEFVDEFIKKTSRKSGFELIKDLLKKFNPNKDLSAIPVGAKHLQKFVLIGHSFGGQVAIKYTIKYPEQIDKLILTGAAGIRHELNTKQKMFFYLAKFGKIIFSLPVLNRFQEYGQRFLYKLAREKDYYKASPRMKEIMKNILNEDLTDYFDKIKTPTLLVWGKEDKTTPLADGEIMNEKIKDSELVVINDANHSLPYQKAEEFTKIVGRFIKK